jgi:hypothetical protein
MLAFIYLADLSLSSVKKYYSTDPVIYTDSIGEKLFTAMGYNVVNCYDNVFEEINTKMWAYPKICTYEKQTKPYIHFDLDFIFKRHFSIPDCDVFVQCSDTYQHTYTNDLESTGLILPSVFHNSLLKNSWTVGILGMFDMDLNREYSNMSLEYFNLNSSREELWRDTTMTNTVLEQQLLAALALDKNVKCLTEKECFETADFKHYVSFTKMDSFIRPYINRYITQDHYDYLRILENAIQSKS